LNSDKEHVTPFLKRNCETNGGLLYSSICIKSAIDFSLIRMTVDEKSDFDAIKLLVNELGFNLSWIDYSQYIINNLTKFSNQKIQRNQGYFLSIKND
jgi:spore coat polysaccharide biosynthesis protein SpsF (cytidylyltransferase family)